MRTHVPPITKGKTQPAQPIIVAPASKPDALRDPLRVGGLADPLAKKAAPAEVPEIVATAPSALAAPKPELVAPVVAAPSPVVSAAPLTAPAAKAPAAVVAPKAARAMKAAPATRSGPAPSTV